MPLVLRAAWWDEITGNPEPNVLFSFFCEYEQASPSSQICS